ncbi:MAG: peptide deformylase [Gemmatimonadota bacterium]
MALLPLRFMGDPILRTRADEVEEVDEELRALVADMLETMYAEDGVGLAAPQVGVGRRIIVLDPRHEGAEPLALVNPAIVVASAETDKAEEGCLSIPGIVDVVERSTAVEVEALDPAGKPLRFAAEGLLARVLLHEVDHLDGVLFVDRVSPMKRRMLLKKWAKVKPEEAP